MSAIYVTVHELDRGRRSCLADIAAREKRVAMLDALLALAREAEGGT